MTEVQVAATEPIADVDGSSKSKGKAQAAYASRDISASRLEHMKQSDERKELESGDYIKAIVFGGLDGITTTFAIVTAAAGAGEGWKVVLIFGFANAIADAWSMGFGEFIGEHAERDHYRAERAREEWEVEHNIAGEIAEMEEIYVSKGFPEEDAVAIVALISKDPTRFVDIMMVEELGLLVDLEDKHLPLKKGLVMFVSFIIMGIIPLLAYLGGVGQGVDYIFGIACGLTGLGMLGLGALKGHLTSQSVPRTAMIMLGQGVVSGAFSFCIGLLVNYIVTGHAL
jgi:VIT1/CCC1 family predicted Fe2+/Mn2+ transporter